MPLQTELLTITGRGRSPPVGRLLPNSLLSLTVLLKKRQLSGDRFVMIAALLFSQLLLLLWLVQLLG